MNFLRIPLKRGLKTFVKSRMNTFLKPAGLCLAVLLVSSSVHAKTYYIATNGDDTWDGSSPTYLGGTTGPWADFVEVNYGGPVTLNPGDAIFVLGGTYVVPKQTSFGVFLNLAGVSGTQSSPIVISNYSGQTPFIYSSPVTNNSGGIILNGCQWVKVFGLQETNNFYGAMLEQSTNCELGFCDFGGGPAQPGYSLTCEFIQNSVSNYIHNCTVHDCVVISPAGDSGHALTFGQAFGTYNGKPDHTGYNIIESNTVYHACHDAMSIYCPGNVVRQNFVHNEGFVFRLDIQTIGAARCMEVGGVYGGAGNVIEDNRLQYAGLTPTSGSHGVEIDGAGSSIYRNNTMSDCMYSGITVYGGKFSMATGKWGGNFIYNNTVALNGLGLHNWFYIPPIHLEPGRLRFCRIPISHQYGNRLPLSPIQRVTSS